MTEKANWREMPAGRELDRLIAERLGHPTFTEPIPESERDLYKPGITELSWMRVNGIPIPVPHYSTDANAALSLIEGTEEGNDYLLRKLNTGWHIHAYWGDSGKITATEPTIALAVCRAWLAYQDAKK